MLWQISLIIVALAFGVLVYYLVQTLKSLRGSLDEIRETMAGMKGELAQVSTEVKDVLHNTNQMAVDVRTKLQDLEPLFRSVNDVGTMIHELTRTVKESASSVATVIQDGRRRALTAAPGKVQKVMSGIPVAIDLWNSFRQRKDRHTAAMK
ncbi:DUF948 domain-containing protein [Paenibacillus sp. HJGM_3]|uniref:DUF948 domain-containing protein n=1 Tax=Paenibacillus sp. HJGM_3 TaxID=3379816 RepID=UPI00385EFBDB